MVTETLGAAVFPYSTEVCCISRPFGRVEGQLRAQEHRSLEATKLYITI